MSRRSPRSWRPRVAALRSPIVLVCLAGLVPAARADQVAPKPREGAPTVTFSSSGPAPLVCTSRPDPSHLDLDRGEWFNVVNQTGVEAVVSIDGEARDLTVSDQMGISIRLSEGKHELRLIPSCLVTVGDASPLVVEVGPVDSRAGRPPPDGRGGGPAEREAGGSPGQATSGPGSGGSATGGPPGASGTAATPAGSSPATEPADEIPDGEEYQVEGPWPPTHLKPDNGGFRLLAIIAAICVFGVSVAIIRVILAQRATKMLAT